MLAGIAQLPDQLYNYFKDFLIEEEKPATYWNIMQALWGTEPHLTLLSVAGVILCITTSIAVMWTYKRSSTSASRLMQLQMSGPRKKSGGKPSAKLHVKSAPTISKSTKPAVNSTRIEEAHRLINEALDQAKAAKTLRGESKIACLQRAIALSEQLLSLALPADPLLKQRMAKFHQTAQQVKDYCDGLLNEVCTAETEKAVSPPNQVTTSSQSSPQQHVVAVQTKYVVPSSPPQETAKLPEVEPEWIFNVRSNNGKEDTEDLPWWERSTQVTERNKENFSNGAKTPRKLSAATIKRLSTPTKPPGSKASDTMTPIKSKKASAVSTASPSSRTPTAKTAVSATSSKRKSSLRQPKKAKPSTDENRKPKSSQDPTDEALKGVEPRLLEMIENEIVSNCADVSWDDIMGLQGAKKALKEMVILPMERPDLFSGLREPARGLLLFGPPGNGKTMLAKALANRSGATFFNISASSLTSKWVGEGEKMVRALFAMAASRQPSIVFIDEIDSLLSSRSSSEHEASRRLKNEFLIRFDGVTSGAVGERIIVMGATNRPEDLDEAARRRLVKRIYVPLPEEEGRLQLIKNLLKRQRSSLSDRDLKDLAKLADGYSASDLTALCKESALEPLRELGDQLCDARQEDIRPISKRDFVRSMEVIRPSVSKTSLKSFEEWNREFGCSA